ncbi:hypothetical protein Mal15_37440 [Stieleria maiorica]|uniref:Uncharacterized protein n=1 Tax=Stieleria maiorica TaxID=2795974 RepID=A0A5B9MF01_9BACT|nr:hypothetical protein [Stieleria maiorica]QEF99678.1 hypothetical protein Mal15_37440 [Stieleria maiorica]
MLGETLSPPEKEQLAELMRLDRFRLKMLYWDLPTPSIADLAGEYDAQLLDQGDPLGTFLTRTLFGSKGPWLGKAFRPISDTCGEGYNAFGTVEDRRALLPMDTSIDHSLVVPGDSFILDYRHRNWGPICWLRGEVRRVSESVFLGMGTFGPRRRNLHKFRRVIPFVMVHCDRPYLNLATQPPMKRAG